MIVKKFFDNKIDRHSPFCAYFCTKIIIMFKILYRNSESDTLMSGRSIYPFGDKRCRMS